MWFTIEKVRFNKKNEAEVSLSNLGLKSPLQKIPLLCDILFCGNKMNEKVNKFLLAVDKFMPDMHSRGPEFTYSAYGPSTKDKEKTNKFKETGYSRYIYKNKPNKAWFQHDMVNRDVKDLLRRTASDKLVSDKAFSIGKNPKYNEC